MGGGGGGGLREVSRLPPLHPPLPTHTRTHLPHAASGALFHRSAAFLKMGTPQLASMSSVCLSRATHSLPYSTLLTPVDP